MVNSLYRVVFPVSNKTLNSGDCHGKEHSMKELSIINHNGIKVVDSREVAQSVEIRHADLLEKLNTYSDFLANGKFRSLDFFVPSVYVDAQGKTRPCYLLTKKGCDMVANKMTGEKGVLFTAAYVTAFEKMRESLTEKKPMTAAQMFAMQAQVNLEQEQRLTALESRFDRTESTMQRTMDIFGAPACEVDDWCEKMNHEINTIVEQYGLNHQKFRSEVYAQVEQEAGVDIGLRQKRRRNRMKKNGATSSECKAVSKLQIIAADKKLRAIFESVLRRRAAKLLSSSELIRREA